MTMHLLGPAYTTTQTTRRKSKTTTAKQTKLANDWLNDCKFCKRLGIKPKTFEEYQQYRSGNYKLKLRGTPMPEYNVSNHREKYPSGGERTPYLSLTKEQALDLAVALVEFANGKREENE
jgi:hypothetical protein